MAIGIGDLGTMAIGDTGIIDKLWLGVTNYAILGVKLDRPIVDRGFE